MHLRHLSRCPSAIFGALLLGALAARAAAAATEPDILRPEQAFRYAVEVAADELRVRWDIEPGHYLYRERMSFESRTPGVTLGPAAMPAGKPYEDEFFGRMEIYRGEVLVRIPLGERPGGSTPLQLAIRSQGCADIGLCYPPQTWLADLRLPPAAPVAGGGGIAADLLAPTGSGLKDAPLPVAQAFPYVVEVVDPFNLLVTWKVADGYYLYRHTLQAASGSDRVQFGPPELPPGTPKWDEEYGDTLVFYGTVGMRIPLQRAGPEPLDLPLTLEFQGCKENSICYPPQRVDLRIELPTGAGAAAASAPVSAGAEQDRLAQLVATGNLFAVMGVFLGVGLLLAFTPCCLPMIPILSGIIVGQGGTVTTSRAFLLSLSYVLGMAVTYTAAGAAFAAAGAQIQAVLQQPWVIVLVAALFVALALAMFGLYDLQVPASLQTRLNALSSRQRGGSFVGAAVMGLVSALVVTTCVTPPLVAALAVIAQSGDVARGALALFALSLGMGLPLLVIGTSAGRLLPRAGPWMNTIKLVFGLVMLALAVWMLDRLLPGALTLALWAVLLIVAGVFLGAFQALDASAGPERKLGKAAGVLALLYGSALFIGALAGNEDPFQPLRFARSPTAASEHALDFRRIKTVADLDRELAAARAAGQPVMLDFYADWCVSCKEMERFTFSDPAVATALSGVVLLQADVTAVDADDLQLMQRFGIVGPPTIIFFGSDGREAAEFRLVGFKGAEEFAEHVAAAFTRPVTA